MDKKLVLLFTVLFLIWAFPKMILAADMLHTSIDVDVQVTPHAEVSITQGIEGDRWYLGELYNKGPIGPFRGRPEEIRWAEGYLTVVTNTDVVLTFAADSYPTLNGIELPITSYYAQQWSPNPGFRWDFTKNEPANITGVCLAGTSIGWKVFAEGQLSSNFWEVPAGNYHGVIEVTVAPM